MRISPHAPGKGLKVIAAGRHRLGTGGLVGLGPHIRRRKGVQTRQTGPTLPDAEGMESLLRDLQPFYNVVGGDSLRSKAHADVDARWVSGELSSWEQAAMVIEDHVPHPVAQEGLEGADWEVVDDSESDTEDGPDGGDMGPSGPGGGGGVVMDITSGVAASPCSGSSSSMSGIAGSGHGPAGSGGGDAGSSVCMSHSGQGVGKSGSSSSSADAVMVPVGGPPPRPPPAVDPPLPLPDVESSVIAWGGVCAEPKFFESLAVITEVAKATRNDSLLRVIDKQFAKSSAKRVVEATPPPSPCGKQPVWIGRRSSSAARHTWKRSSRPCEPTSPTRSRWREPSISQQNQSGIP